MAIGIPIHTLMAIHTDIIPEHTSVTAPLVIMETVIMAEDIMAAGITADTEDIITRTSTVITDANIDGN